MRRNHALNLGLKAEGCRLPQRIIHSIVDESRRAALLLQARLGQRKRARHKEARQERRARAVACLRLAAEFEEREAAAQHVHDLLARRRLHAAASGRVQTRDVQPDELVEHLHAHTLLLYIELHVDYCRVCSRAASTSHAHARAPV